MRTLEEKKRHTVPDEPWPIDDINRFGTEIEFIRRLIFAIKLIESIYDEFPSG
jgi:hypothetical protein